jgi:hypothetical protein
MQITVGALVDTFQRDEGVSSRTTAQLDALLADSQNLFGALRDTAQAVDRGTEASQNVSRLVGASTEAMQSAAQSSLTVSANFLDAALSLQLISQSLRQREDDQHLGSSGLLIQPLITSGVTPTFSQEKPEISATSNQRLTDGSLTSPHA